MFVQQISVKLFATPGHSVDQDEYIAVFHKWIREQRIAKDKLLIDVADYKHVHHGPGIMIVGHEAHWAMDEAGGELGVAYYRKRDEVGPAQPKLTEALRDTVEAALALADEPALSGRIGFDASRLSFRISSRLAAQNTAENRAAFETELRTFFGSVAPNATPTFNWDDNPRSCVGATIALAGAPDLKSLATALAA